MVKARQQQGITDEHPSSEQPVSVVRSLRAQDDVEALEAYDVLCDMASGQRSSLPRELLARHIIEVTEGADWTVQREAMKALLRRLGFARRDELRVAERPAGGRRLGRYVTRRKGRKGSGRPYRTWLESVDPPRGSCDCPDYLRSSLGLCKHLLVVLTDLYDGPRKLERSLKEQQTTAAPWRLRWDPIRPLEGPGDWLAGVYWRGGAAPERIDRWLDEDGRLADTFADDVQRRATLVDDLGSLRPRAKRIDPALVALLERERVRLAQAGEVSLVRRRGRWSKGIRRKLYPYQVEGVERFLESGRLLLADDMGLGKTVQAIAACHALFDSGRVRRGLVIAPAALKHQWLREWECTTDVPAAIVEGRPDERADQYAGLERGFLIMNYEQLLRDRIQVHDLAPEMVVLDEAQRIKNWATKTATFVKSLQGPYRLVLTGTPMENRLDELASIFEWVDDMALEPKWRLVPWHTFTEGDAGRGTAGARNLDTLRARLAPRMCRRVRQDVLAQLPSRTDTRVPAEMTGQQMNAHDELSGPIASLMQRTHRRPLTQAEFLRLMSLLTRQRMICNGIALVEMEAMWPGISGRRPTERMLQGLFSPKLLALRHLVGDLCVDQGRKVVIFSQWRRMLRLVHWSLSDLLGDEGLRAVFFTGAETQKQREKSVVEFHDDPSTRVMLLSDAGGVGLNLQRAANACINVELPWNPAVLEQRIGRIYRIGQRQPIDVYNLVAEAGIEARIASVVSDKQALFSGLFDGTSNELRFEEAGSFASKLEKIVDLDAPEEDEDEALDPISAAESFSPARGPESSPPVPQEMEPSLPGRETIDRMLSSLTVRTHDDGGVSIDAPAESAATLASVFGAMARMLEGAQR